MNLSKIARALDTAIRPGSFPIAVTMVGSEEEIPQKAKRPRRDLKIAVPVCQGVNLARRYGWTIAMDTDDMLCPVGAVTLGLLPAKAKLLDGTYEDPPWVKNQEVRAKILQAMPRLEEGKYSHLLVSPIHRAEFSPRVLVIYGNAAQISRLIQAAVFATGDPVTTTSFGCSSCVDEITRPWVTERCQVIITGGGDRVWAQTQDHEIAFSLPISGADRIVEGLEETHRRGMRYPTNSFITYQANFPPDITALMNYLKE